MKNPSRTADRRSRLQGFSGLVSSRPHLLLSRVVRKGCELLQEAGRSIGRLVLQGSRRRDSAFGFLAVLIIPKRRPILAPIAIDSASAMYRRSRMIHRR